LWLGGLFVATKIKKIGTKSGCVFYKYARAWIVADKKNEFLFLNFKLLQGL
jgi:hypothetical protein